MTGCHSNSDAAARRHLDAASAAAAAEVLALLVDRTEILGRSGLIAHLGTRAREAAASPLAADRIRALAYGQAADDLVWGRAPLAGWTLFKDAGAAPTPEQRRALASRLPMATAARRRLAREAVARFEVEGLRAAGSAFTGAQQLPLRLARAIALQEILWDDPRLPASPEDRALMRETLGALKRRRDALEAIVAWPRLEMRKASLLDVFRRRAHSSV